MADIGVNQQWLVTPDSQVERMWLEVQIQERKSRIVRFKQDIEDLTRGRIVDLQAKIMMLEKEIKMMEDHKRVTPVIPNNAIIDAETT